MDYISEEDFWKEALSYSIDKEIKVSDAPELEQDINLSKLSCAVNPQYRNIIYVTRNGAYIDATMLAKEEIRSICNKFMIKSKSNFGNKWNIARSYSIIKRKIPISADKTYDQIMLLLPRFGFLEFYFNTLLKDLERNRKTEYAPMILLKKMGLYNLSNINNQLPTFEKNNSINAVGLKLESHQSKTIEYIMQNHYNALNTKYGYSGINLKLKTGAGKSYIALGLIDRLKMPTLIIVHNQPQAVDTYNLAAKYFPNAKIGCYHSMTKTLGDIMIILIHSACGAEEYVFDDKKMSITEFYSRFGFVIFDESHKYCSSEFSKVFNRCQAMYMMGMSATPNERQDGFDPLTHWNVGPLVDIKQKIPGILADEPFTTKILGIKYLGPPDYTVHKVSNAGMFDYDATLTQMMNDPYRLKLAIFILKFLYENKRNTYIFSDRLEYLSVLRREFFAELRKSGTFKIDTLDDDMIEFMKNQPTYATYVQNLYKSINAKLISEQNKIKEDVNNLVNNAKYLELRKSGIDKNAWYSQVEMKNFEVYSQSLIKTANNVIQGIWQKYNDIVKAESTKEYFADLLETYKKNFIDDYIETTSTLSVLTGGASGEKITMCANNATMIFTTYGYMGTGKSIPKMDTVLELTPRRNGVEQVIGRIFRPGPNKNVRWIIDIIDWRINLKSQWYERLNVYNKQKEQNRCPSISETEFFFDKLDNVYSMLNNVFIDSNVVHADGMLFDFSKIKIEDEEKPKKLRIIKKF